MWRADLRSGALADRSSASPTGQSDARIAPPARGEPVPLRHRENGNPPPAPGCANCSDRGDQQARTCSAQEPRYHVSPSANRESIIRFGLDWTRMDSAECGLANVSPGQPETEGIFLTSADIDEARWFAEMGSGRDVDVWSVDVTDLPIEDLEAESGWWVCREPIPPERIELVEAWATTRSGRLRPPGAHTKVSSPSLSGLTARLRRASKA
jgi:hypothetical protein